jgi:signal transduction histidine kinase/CheY-like chemotaxis protein
MQVAGVSVGLVLLSGWVDGWFNYQEARTQLAALQTIQAQAAAAEIEQYLATVRRSLEAVQALPWGQAGFGPRERLQELQRLLPLNPALVQVRDVGADGRDWVRVSRTEPDWLNPEAPQTRRPQDALNAHPGGRSSAPPAMGYTTPEFDAAGEPVVQLAMAYAPQPGAYTLTTLNLRFLADVVSGLRLAQGGEVYVVDASNRLIAHPDPAQVLRQRQLGAEHDAVNRARLALAAGSTRLEATEVQGLTGERALATALLLRDTGWLLVVEQPRAQALQPVWATLQRTAALLALAVVAALLVSAAFARRMAAPVARLRAATAAIAQGRRGERIQLQTGDELQGLAGDFNTMVARLETSYAELEAKVADRTAEAVRGRRDAEQARQAMTRFLAMASHDLRQPMHAIGLMVSVLRAGAMTADRQGLHERIDRVYRAVRGMDSMFSGLLDVTKLDAGAVKPQLQPVSVASLFERLATLHAALAQSKGLQFRVRRSAWGVESDPEELHRMLSNLCTNAIRYTPRGGVLLAAQRRGSQVWLRVFDTGTGIAPDQQEHIFDEFVRLGPGRGAGADEGLGLGLSIVRRTARLLGATVAVRSTPGRGSCFTLALPLSAAVATPMSEGLAEGGDLARAFAIVVDDDALNLGSMADLLRSWGTTVATAAGNESALAECSRHLRTPDVIVTDLRLGDGPDGLSLIRHLRAQAGWPIPALLVTAEPKLPREPDGDVHVLQKPVADTVLRAALEQALAAGHLLK